MNSNDVRCYCLSKPAAQEDFPFGDDVAVFKVKNKLFGLLSERQGQHQINLKCDPEQAFILRDLFAAVIPGYHMNKKHWNTVILDGSIPQGELERMIDHSYSLVVKGMPKKNRTALEIEFGPESIYRGL